MKFDTRQRYDLLQARAASYVEVAMETATKEYPHFPYFIATGPESYRLHREFHPAFYGSFDWHSCVEMHWVAVRLLRLFPEETARTNARPILNSLLTSENIAREMEFFADPSHKSLERPYGWGWLLMLAAELCEWDDLDGRRWSDAVDPLAHQIIGALVDWLPRLTYPQRLGVHPNTAFSLINTLSFARLSPEETWADAITQAARRLFLWDVAYPFNYEPSGADFLSPGLCEAVLMQAVLDQDDFQDWFRDFIPQLVSDSPEPFLTPAIISDPTDGQIAHLHGLNLSRAWALIRLSETFPQSDSRRELMIGWAEEHAGASLPFVTGSDYMVEHWLAAYATLLLSA